VNWLVILQSTLSSIRSPLFFSRIQDGRADYVACHHESYVEANKFDVARFIKKGGVFFLNTKIASMQPHQRLEALEANVSPKILREYDIPLSPLADPDSILISSYPICVGSLALRKVKFFIMDAAGLASKFGLRGR